MSITQRPYASTFGPWLPGHWYQKSSTLTYWKPTAARPLLFIASACASMLAAVGLLPDEAPAAPAQRGRQPDAVVLGLRGGRGHHRGDQAQRDEW